MLIHAPNINTKHPIFVDHTSISNAASVSFSVRDYAMYFFVLQSIVPASDGVDLGIRFSVNGSEIATGYTFSNFAFRSGASASNSSATDTMIRIVTITAGVGSAAGEAAHALVWFYQSPPQSSVQYQASYMSATPATAQDYGGGRLNAGGLVDAVSFLFGTGNIESGFITCFGLE